MRIDREQYRQYAAAQTTPRPADDESRVRDEAAPKEAEPTGRKYPWEEEEYLGIIEMLRRFAEKPKDASTNGADISKPKDPSGQLTRRLVSAGGQVEVRQIVAEAGGALVKLRIYAATASGAESAAAKAAIRRIEKLLSRAGRKIKDLDGEDLLKVRKIRAEQERQEKRAERIKEELKLKRIKRMIQEHGYLREQKGEGFRRDDLWEGQHSIDPAVEAEIVLQAQEIAAAETVAGEGAAPAGAESGGEVEQVAVAEGGGESE